MDRLNDFEEECMEGYMKKVKQGDRHAKGFAGETAINELSQRVEQLSSGLQRLERQNDCQNLTKLEDLCDQTAASLAVIHRYDDGDDDDDEDDEDELDQA